jgi:hypothetical protein
LFIGVNCLLNCNEMITKWETISRCDWNDGVFTILPSDVVLYILDFYELPFHRYMWKLEFDLTAEAIEFATKLFYGWFRNDSFRTPLLLYRCASLSSWSRYGYLRSNGSLDHSMLRIAVNKLLPKSITALDMNGVRERKVYKGFSNLTSLNLKNALPLRVDIIQLMESNSRSLTNLDLSESNLILSNMFSLNPSLFTNLKHLNLGGCPPNETGLASIFNNLTNLEVLNIRKAGVHIGSNVFQNASRCTKLKEVILPNINPIIGPITFAPSLRSIHIGSRTRNSLWEPYKANLWLSFIRVTAPPGMDLDSFLAISSCQDLQELELHFGILREIEDEEAEILASRPLRRLSFTRALIDKVVDTLFDRTELSRSLQSFAAHGDISDASLIILLENALNLKKLNIAVHIVMPVPYHSLQLMKVIATHPSLTDLNCSRCSLEDQHIEILAQNQNLAVLDISHNVLVNHSLVLLLAKLTRLEELSLVEINIDDDGWSALFGENSLKALNVSHLSNTLTREHVDMLKRNTTLAKLFIYRSFEHENDPVFGEIVRECLQIQTLVYACNK